MSKLDEIIKEWDKNKITLGAGGDVPMEWCVPEWLCEALVEALKGEVVNLKYKKAINRVIDLAFEALKKEEK